MDTFCLRRRYSLFLLRRDHGLGVETCRAGASAAATALASISLLLAIHLIGYHSCGFIHFADSSETLLCSYKAY